MSYSNEGFIIRVINDSVAIVTVTRRMRERKIPFSLQGWKDFPPAVTRQSFLDTGFFLSFSLSSSLPFAEGLSPADGEAPAIARFVRSLVRSSEVLDVRR